MAKRVPSKKSLENLKPFDSTQDREQAKINGRKGGKARQEQLRKRKTIKEALDILLSMPYKDDKDKTNLEVMTIALFEKALTGDTKAFEVIRDSIGEKIADKTEIQQVQKVYVSKEEVLEVNKHIDDIIND